VTIWEAAIRHVLVLLALRGAPSICYVCAASRFPFKARILALLLALCAVAALLQLGAAATLLIMSAGLAYYGTLALAVQQAARLYRRALISAPLLFVMLASVFVVLPGMLLSSLATIPFLIVGWELTMRSYSYCVDTARMHSLPSTGECAFFLLVNPVLVFAERGARAEGSNLEVRGLSRFLLGIGVLLVGTLALRPLTAELRHYSTEETLSDLFSPVAFGVAWIFAEYAAHSGLASLRIGLMRLMGYRIPECYAFPILALNPIDFWRRWNIYRGRWLLRYAFTPLTRFTTSLGLGRGGLVVALFATFVASGLMHEFYAYMSSGRFNGRFLMFFLVAGVAAVGWLAVERGATVLTAGLTDSWRVYLARLARATSHGVMVCCFLVVAVTWGRRDVSAARSAPMTALGALP
jgi:hypothetical protein